MPGARSDWGDLPLVVDTSAWARARHEQVRAAWQRALAADQFRLAPIVRMEILFNARDGGAFDSIAEELSALRPAPMGHSVVRAAEECMRFLAQRSAGAHRIPIVDYLVAAAAQESGAAVLHYDRDYDTLAEVLSFESIWLVPAGSLP